MTIGANLNGGSLTIGAAGATTNINSNITNIAKSGLSATGRVFIASETNTSGSYVHIGSSTLSGLYLRGKDVLINYQQGTPQAPVDTYIGNDTAGSTNILGQTNIANTGLSTNDGVNIATGTNAAGAQVTIGSTSLTAVNIKGGQTNLETTTLNLNTTGAGNTLIGTSGGSNSITINRPLTPAYTYSAVAPIGSTGSGKIGEIVSATYSAVTFTTSGTGYSIGNLSLTKGTWILTGNCYIVIPAITVAQTYWSSSLGGEAISLQQFGNQNESGNFGCVNTTSYYVSATSTLSCFALFVFVGTPPSSLAFGYTVQAVRIA
jgi:hypothetical protein